MAFVHYRGSTSPKGIFMTLEIKDILEIRDKATAIVKEGKTIMEYKDSGTDIRKDWPIDPPTVLLECRYALQIKDPDRFGGIDRVRVSNMLYNFRGL
jgi:hypothetical protein